MGRANLLRLQSSVLRFICANEECSSSQHAQVDHWRESLKYRLSQPL
jgi:hypothetical protein